MNALDPKTCTRCNATVTADATRRPERVTSSVFAPLDPRPLLPAVGHATWEVAADTAERGRVAALLCAPCVDGLVLWLYDDEETR